METGLLSVDEGEKGKHVCKQREKKKVRNPGLRVGTLNVGTITGKARELVDMMQRRKVDILCVQDIRWKSSKARSSGAGFKVFHHGLDMMRNGVEDVLKEDCSGAQMAYHDFE